MRGARSSRFTVSPALISDFFLGFCGSVVGVCCFGLAFVFCLCLPSRFRDHFSCLPERTTVGAVMARTAWEKKNDLNEDADDGMPSVPGDSHGLHADAGDVVVETETRDDLEEFAEIDRLDAKT